MKLAEITIADTSFVRITIQFFRHYPISLLTVTRVKITNKEFNAFIFFSSRDILMKDFWLHCIVDLSININCEA